MAINYRVLNIFADPNERFTGNQLCVVEDGTGLSSDEMQGIARQMSVETSFLIPDGKGGYAVRFFQPEREIGFAGSASIGSATVIADLLDDHTGHVDIKNDDTGEVFQVRTFDDEPGVWWIDARPTRFAEEIRTEKRFLSGLIGRPMDRLLAPAMRVASSRVGVVMPLASADDVRAASLDARLLHQYALLLNTEPQVYVWAWREDGDVEARMFYGPGGGVLEVAATASGAANLGGWLAANDQSPKRTRVHQGSELGRPSIMELDVLEGGQVTIGGRVNEVARGTLS